jgi:hypothetical protein
MPPVTTVELEILRGYTRPLPAEQRDVFVKNVATMLDQCRRRTHPA